MLDRRLAPVVALLAIASCAFVGCAAPATPSESPQATGTIPARDSVPPSVTASPSEVGVDGAAAENEVADVCLSAHESTDFGGGGRVTGDVDVYPRTVKPKWLVIIPAENEYGDYYLECLVDDDSSGLTTNQFGTLLTELLTDEYLEWRVNENEAGA